MEERRLSAAPTATNDPGFKPRRSYLESTPGTLLVTLPAELLVDTCQLTSKMFQTFDSHIVSNTNGGIMQDRFSSRDVIALTGVTARQLQWWDERGVVKPAARRAIAASIPCKTSPK